MVNEVDASGQVVHLDNKLAPQVYLPSLIKFMLTRRKDIQPRLLARN